MASTNTEDNNSRVDKKTIAMATTALTTIAFYIVQMNLPFLLGNVSPLVPLQALLGAVVFAVVSFMMWTVTTGTQKVSLISAEHTATCRMSERELTLFENAVKDIMDTRHFRRQKAVRVLVEMVEKTLTLKQRRAYDKLCTRYCRTKTPEEARISATKWVLNSRPWQEAMSEMWQRIRNTRRFGQ